MVNPKSLKAAMALLLVILMAAPVLAYAVPPAPGHGYSSDAWMNKFHPALLSKVLAGELSDDDVVTVFFRLSPLPAYTKAYVKGDYEKAVNALKEWAATTQAPFVFEAFKKGAEVLNKFWIDNLVLVKAPLSVVKELAAYPGVVEVFENFEVHVIEPTEMVVLDPKAEVESWGIFKIDAPGAWAKGYLGEGVRIATLDTGVDVTHPALEGKMLTLDPTSPYYPGGWMEFDANGDPVLSQPHDTHGHGTHVSGTALGGDTENILIGVAPGATLMHGLVLTGGSGTFAQVLAGIQWAVEPFYIDPDSGEIVYTGLPAHVISMSLGAPGYYGNELFPGIEAALLANIIVVAAIGNSGPGTSGNPGNIWGVFGIGATDQNDQDAYFSSGEVVNWPDPPEEWPFYDTYPSQYIKPDFSAPGVSITSSVPGGGYAAWSGTSMATPHVAGVVALILQATGWYEEPVEDTPERVYEILKNTSLDLGDPGQDIRFGWGRVNASAAVELAEQYAKKSGVQGIVLDSIDETPIKWATVTVLETNKTVKVRPDGTFKIPLDPGVYHLLFEAWGYYNKTIEVEVILLNGTIVGQVFDAISGNPIQGASVTVTELNITVYTDADGFFNVSVPAGSYNLHVEASGYHPADVSVSVDENETVFVPIPLTPAGYGTIEGYVFDAVNMTPIENAIVMVDYDYNYSAVTGPDGYFIITDVPAGMHVVTAMAIGYSLGIANVTLAPNETVMINFTLEPIPPSVVVIGNAEGHIIDLLATNITLPVIAYDNATAFLQDWINFQIYPATIVIDHWNVDYYDIPPSDVILGILYMADAFAVPMIFLDTPYSGYTAMFGLNYYYSDVTSAGFLAPASYEYHYPSAEYIKILMLNETHPIFDGVVPDNDSWFYLADLADSYYADYVVFYSWSDTVDFVGNLIDDYNSIEAGAIGFWTSQGGSLWIILSSFAESYWMQYLEPGSDGKYSQNSAIVLVNAVEYALANYMPGSITKPISLAKAVGLAIESGASLKPSLYTNVTVYLDRLPHGYVMGKLCGSDGVPLANAKIVVEGTPVEVYTNETGYFKFWLPEGEYTLEFYAKGYKSATLNITVDANETVDLGKIVLQRVPRVAILYDYSGQLKSLIEAKGWYAEDFSSPSDFASALRSGFFDAGIWAGYYLAPFPTEAEFFDVWNAINETGISVIFMDQWSHPWYPDIFGYGIRAMNYYLGDPAGRIVGSYYGDVYIQIEAPSPIFRGYDVGDIVKIINYNTQGYGTDYAAFTGFSGATLASLLLGGTEYAGDAIAYKVLENGAKIILMASWAPEEYQDISWWTEDMIQIFHNAVTWAVAKPINVTPSYVEAFVGDLITFTISQAPANTTFNVSIDGEVVDQIVTDANGTATYTLKVPVIPGGEHTIMFESTDYLYSGTVKLVVKAKIEVSTTNVTVPASVYYNVTGLPAGALVHLFIDSNYLGSGKASENGVLAGVINLPFVSDGMHRLLVLDENYGRLACVKIYTNTSLAQIGADLQEIASTLNMKLDDIKLMLNTTTADIMSMLSSMNASLVQLIETKSGDIYALVEQNGQNILAKLDDVKSLVNAKYSDLESLIESVNGTLVQLIETKSGDIYALIQTESGNIIAKIDTSTNNIMEKLNTIESLISQNLTQTLSATKSRANTSMAVGGVALVLSLAGIFLAFRGGRIGE